MEKIIVIATRCKDYHITEIQQLAADYRVILNEDLTDADYADIEIIYGFDADLVDKLQAINAPSLKWIQMPFAGIDQLPEEWLMSENLLITSMSGIHAIPITESVFGMMLAEIHNFSKYFVQQADAIWERYESKTLTDKTIIIFGAGKIGREIARLAKQFRMTTIGVNTSGRAVDNFDFVYKSDDPMPLLPGVDFIVNALPLTKTTINYFDAEFFSLLKDQPMFINVGRGEAVEDETILDALDHGNIRCAALDVFQDEPLPKDHPFWKHAQIFITPHVAGQIEHFAVETFKIFAPNLKSYLQTGIPAINLVDGQKGY